MILKARLHRWAVDIALDLASGRITSVSRSAIDLLHDFEKVTSSVSSAILCLGLYLDCKKLFGSSSLFYYVCVCSRPLCTAVIQVTLKEKAESRALVAHYSLTCSERLYKSTTSKIMLHLTKLAVA